MRDKKFLVVDDDSDDKGLFTEALTAVEPGIICYSADDGQEALKKLDSKLIEPPDIIFMDINMPIMNGWECLVKLKSAPGYKDIPVIIHTTSSRITDRQLARDLGAICFFTKLNDFSKLKKMLEIVVEKMNNDSVDAICDAVYKYLNLN
jgi:CheY-like chemotaxis protein